MRPLALILFLFACATPVAAQTTARPNFAGDWLLDPARTTVTGAPARVSGPGRIDSQNVIQAPVKVRHVPPAYPEGARRARVSGLVIIEAAIDTKGNVRDVEVIKSVPELDRAAMEAVAQWKFRPSTLDGTPIATIMTVTVTFAMSGAPPVSSNDLRAFARGRGPGTGGGAGMGPVPETLAITQNQDQLRMVRPAAGRRETVTYRFNGKASENRIRIGGAAVEVDQTFVSRWENQTLVTEVTWDTAMGRQERTETISLEGDTLIVELRRPSFEPGGPPTVRTVVYRRKP